MTNEQKKLLEPFAQIMQNMDLRLGEMDPAELHDLAEACDAVSYTNCWCFTFDAAKILSGYISRRRNAGKSI